LLELRAVEGLVVPIIEFYSENELAALYFLKNITKNQLTKIYLRNKNTNYLELFLNLCSSEAVDPLFNSSNYLFC